MAAELRELTDALGRQWARLSAWLHSLGDDLGGAGEDPSTCDGWTNRQLVAHLGRALDALRACEPAPPGTNPLSLAEYLGTYPERAAEIARVSRDLAAELGDDPLPAVDAIASQTFAHLAGLGTNGALVLQARRAPVTLRDMVASRLIELVVHADDLVRSLSGVPQLPGPLDPIDPGARALVADELLGIVTTRGGWDVNVADARIWIALATGREPYNVDRLAMALAPAHASEGVPDLGRSLPIL